MKKSLVNKLFAATLVISSFGIAIALTIPSHAQTPSATPTPTPTATPQIRPPFRDIQRDTYSEELNMASGMGTGTTFRISKFISGFDGDETFRPLLPLTREQLVSMVLAGIAGNITPVASGSNQLTGRPYTDVETSRWSAVNIQWAKNNKIVTGYSDGSFRPDQPITRAELIAVQRRAAEYALSLRGINTPQLTPTQTPINFSDMSGHWAASLATQMSGYCKVASPLNEAGTAFAPNTPSQRNYGAAATVRMITCVRQTLDSSRVSPPAN